MGTGKAGSDGALNSGQSKKVGKKIQTRSGNSALPPHNPQCPQCGSNRTWKDGLRETKVGLIQRYLCRICGFRFSQLTSAFPKHSDTSDLTIVNCRVGVSKEMKNLARVEPLRNGLAGATKTDSLTVKGIIAKFAYWLEKEGYISSEYLSLIERLTRIGVNLLDPEEIKEAIAKQPWKNGTKMLAVYAYDAMVKMLNLEWSPPRYVKEETLPFVPDEKELDQLIAGCRSHRMATFLQTLKETFADPGEVLRLRWINVSGNTITINDPVKRHNPRQLKISSKLLAMLNALHRTSDRIFPTTYNSIYTAFVKVRKRVARVTQNQRIAIISFKSFRHWGATMTFHHTKNLLLVQKILGHKSIQNTMKYTHLMQFKDDEFDVATATTIDEAKELAATGFEYFTKINGVQVFRKAKMFEKYVY